LTTIDVSPATPVLHASKRIAAVAASAALVLLAVASPAQAAAPCWKALITDWYDGEIDKSYAIPCYQQAVDHLPTDARLYSSARDDILRAMQLEIAAQKAAETPTTTAAATTAQPPPPPPPPPPPATTEAAPVTTTPTTTEQAAAPPPTTTAPGRQQPKGVAAALDDLNSDDPDEFPLPLLVLGGVAILLVAAGVAGMIWRRRGGPDEGAPPVA
jgi:hypothetical protein